MRVTISHSKTKAEAMQAVDRAMDDLFRGFDLPAVTLLNPQKSWNGSVMTFSTTAQMAFMKSPISGTVEVTERDIIIDADLGLLNRFLPEDKTRELFESRIRGLLT